MHTPASRRRGIATALLLIVFALATSVPASAAPGSVSALQPISGPLPAAAACSPDTPNHDAEWEPALAVNPGNPDNLIAAWIQGQSTPLEDPGNGIAVAVSLDGGATWARVVVPGMTRCGSPIVDPQISFGPEGAAYLVAKTLGLFPPGLDLTVIVSRSMDGGFTWSPQPANASPPAPTLNDYPRIAAEPDQPGAASVVYLLGPHNSTMFTRTIDGGASWTLSAPAAISEPGTLPSGRILALPDGTLLIVSGETRQDHFGGGGADPRPDTVIAVRSEDKGMTWSTPPIVIAEVAFHIDLPVATVGPDGAVYVSWRRRLEDGTFGMFWARSRDSGRTWTEPALIRTVPGYSELHPGSGRNAIGQLNPGIAVAGDGTIGILYDDLRNDAAGEPGKSADVWLAHSHDDGATWEESHIAGPFDFETIPDRIGFMGDYQDLVGFADGFGAVFAQAAPAAVDGATDIFFARLTLSSPPPPGTRASGNGWLADRSGKKIHFDFNVKAGTTLKGKFDLDDAAGGVRIELQEFGFLGAVGGNCGAVSDSERALEFRGSGTFNGTAGASFRICVEDNGKGGNAAPDRIYLACTAGCSYNTGARAADDAIDGGNIQVNCIAAGGEP